MKRSQIFDMARGTTLGMNKQNSVKKDQSPGA
jgi:hypothetical protein